MDSFSNLCEADNLLSIHLSFINKKIVTANNDTSSILIALKFFNSFLKNKILLLKLTESFNFKVFEPIFHVINGNSLLDQNCRNIAYKDLNRIHDFLSEKNKFNLENYILKLGFELSKLIENPQLKQEDHQIQDNAALLANNNDNSNMNKMDKKNLKINLNPKSNEYNQKIADNTLICNNNYNNDNYSKVISGNISSTIQSNTIPNKPIQSNNGNYNPTNTNTNTNNNNNINEGNQIRSNKIITIQDYQVILDKAINKLLVGSHEEKEKAMKEIEITFFKKENNISNPQSESCICFCSNINKYFYAVFEAFKNLAANNSNIESFLDLITSMLRSIFASFNFPGAVMKIEQKTVFEVFDILLNIIQNLDSDNFNSHSKAAAATNNNNTHNSDNNALEREHTLKTISSKTLQKLILYFNISDSLCALFDLIRKHHKSEYIVLTIGRILMQLGNQIIKEKIEETQIDKVLFAILLLITEMDKDPSAFVENSESYVLNNKIIKIIKIYLHQTISLVKDKIFEFYKKGIYNSGYPDSHLKRMIQGILRKIHGISSEANKKLIENPSQAVLDLVQNSKFSNLANNNNACNKTTNNLFPNTLSSAMTLKTGVNATNINYNNQLQFSALSAKSSSYTNNPNNNTSISNNNNQNQNHNISHNHYNLQLHINNQNQNQENEIMNLIRNFVQFAKESDHVETLNKKRFALQIMNFLKQENLSFNLLRNYLSDTDVNYIKSIENEVAVSSEISKKREGFNMQQSSGITGMQNNRLTSDFEMLMNKVNLKNFILEFLNYLFILIFYCFEYEKKKNLKPI